jgi:hypothetical protein
MGNVSDKSRRENQNIVCSITILQKLCHCWDNVEKYGTARHATDDNIIWLMHFACWKTKASAIHSEYVILIGFPYHQWLREHTPLHLYVHCLPCWIRFSHSLKGTDIHACSCNENILHTPSTDISYTAQWSCSLNEKS